MKKILNYYQKRKNKCQKYLESYNKNIKILRKNENEKENKKDEKNNKLKIEKNIKE